MDLMKIAESINVLGNFCGKRDIEELTEFGLYKRYGIRKADILILFGGSIPHGCDVAAAAIKAGIADNFVIAGGEGHTTESLRRKISAADPSIETAGKAEADIMGSYMKKKYGITDYLLERNSTNCGNNVDYALEVIRKQGLSPESIIIIQDATMQNRMDAGFRKQFPDGAVRIINFAAYHAEVIVEEAELIFAKNDIWGMWDMKRYITLLMGEIPRLQDNELGYGPRGANYIAHAEVPEEVLDAYGYLKTEWGDFTRNAV